MKLVSIGVKGDTVKVALYDGGMLVNCKAFRVIEQGNIYNRALFAVKQALVFSKGYLEEHRDDSVVTFEVSNKAVANWMMGSSEYPRQYTLEMFDIQKLLEEIPIRYVFCWQKTPRAAVLDVKEPKVSSVSELLVED